MAKQAQQNEVGAAEGAPPRRSKARSSPKTTAKAQLEVDELLNKARTRDAQRPLQTTRRKPEAEERDEKGRFSEGHAKRGGRQPGTPNAIPKDAKSVMKGLAAGMITVDGKNAAHVFARQLVRGMEDPDRRVTSSSSRSTGSAIPTSSA